MQVEAGVPVLGPLSVYAAGSGRGQWGPSAHLAFGIKKPNLGLMNCLRRITHSIDTVRENSYCKDPN